MNNHDDNGLNTIIGKSSHEGEMNTQLKSHLTSKRMRNLQYITNTHGKSQIQIILILVVLFVVMSLFNSIRQQSATSGSAVYNLGDMADQMEVREDARMDRIRADVEVLERQYGNERYLKDYSVISNRLNEEFRAKLEKDLQSKTKALLMVRGEVTFFNDVLEEAEEKNLSIDDLLKDTKRSIKDLDIYIDAFADIEKKTDTGVWLQLYGQDKDSLFSLGGYIEELEYEFVMSPNRHCTLTYKIVSKEALEGYTLDELRNMQNLDAFLYSGDWIFEGDSFTPNRSKGLFTVEDIQSLLTNLEAKYNEEFIVYKFLDTFNFLCAPVKHPEMKFEVNYDGNDLSMTDQYLSVLTQANLNKQVDTILEKHGLHDRVVYLNAGSRMGWFDYDTSKLNGDITFIVDDHEKVIETSLYYLVEAGEQPDFDTLKKVVEDIQAIYPDIQSKNYRRHDIFVFFYAFTVEKRPVLQALFKSDSLSMWKMPKDPDFLELEAFHVTDRVTDGFNYLYSYGENEDYTLSIGSSIKDYTTEEMILKTKSKSLWR